ncbi:VWA domain-containing protein [Corynebacterium hindlerae]|uniref:DUF5979 domain-containing protein n=1 Tax=Corynebacterium hindlerae TaxID=699041 RepID=UPI001AD67F9C|nr:DUF5979 domain-containing protein [Corynebacterium hindlerae]QTH59598.1 VWA domain-containing protein [Corynebacterium hindlerae]
MSITKRIAALLATLFMALTILVVPQAINPPKAEAQTSVAGECGATVAFVVDLSNSLSNADVSNLKRALASMINSLAGAPYNIGVYTFASKAPAAGLQNTNMNAVSLQDQAAVQQLLNKVGALELPGNVSAREGGTNWEGGLERVAEDIELGTKYDIVYFITDGKPTFDNSGINYKGNSTEQKELDNAIDQKKRIEKLGGKIIPVGVGDVGSTEKQPIYELRQYQQRVIVGYRSVLTGYDWLGRPIYEDIPVYENRWVTRWEEVERKTSREMLRLIATDDSKTIIARDYQELPGELQSNFVTGCLFVNKNIVDNEGNLLEKGADWKFDLQPLNFSGPGRTLSTDQTGVALTAFEHITSSSRVAITEQQQEGFRLRKATCTAYKPGQQKTEVRVSLTGNKLEVPLDPAKITSCTFENLPSVPMSLGKEVVVTDPVLQQRLHDATFDFTYTCTKDRDTVATGEMKGLKNGERRSIGTVPLGTSCTIKETKPRTEPELYSVATSWKGTNTIAQETSGDGLTHKVKPDPEAYVKRGEAAVTAVNTYSPKMKKIQLSKVIPNRDQLPASQVPQQFPVRYACRYVPTAKDRPDQGSPVNPPFVADGTVLVPLDGTAEIGPFPVGTQCGLTETSTDGNPVSIPGFDLDTSWQSNACDKPGDATAGGLNQCGTNYVWLNPVAGETQAAVAVENKYTRQKGNLVIEKTLSGDAAQAGSATEFSFDVTCTQEGVTAYGPKEIKVRGGQSTRLEDVPVGTTCIVREKDVTIENVDVVKPAEGSAVITPIGSGDSTVVMNNELTYRKAPVSLTKTVDVTQVRNVERVGELTAARFDVTAQCTVPGEESPRELSHTMSDGETWQLGQFPIGTQCVFKEEYEAPENIEFTHHFEPDTATVRSETGEKVTLTNSFATPTGDLKITKHVTMVSGEVADIATFVPKSFNMRLTCGTRTETFSVTDNATHTVPQLTSGETCTLTELASDPAELKRTTTITGQDGTNQESAEGPSYTFQVPDEGGALALQVDNTYEPAMTTMAVEKQARLTYADGSSVPESVHGAFLKDRKFDFTYTCKRGETVVVRERGFELSHGESKEISVPVGSDCTVTENPLKITGASGPTISTAGDATLENSTLTFAKVSTPKKATVTNAYVVETGAFNMKKKVDGDGVATIGRDRKFTFNYKCEYQGDVLKEGTWQLGRFDSGTIARVDNLPVGTTCTVIEDNASAAETDADWSVRWNISEQADGYAEETSCDNLSSCQTADNQATITIVPKETTAEGGVHEQGALVAWNTYHYHQVNLKLAKKLTGDGPDIAQGDTFTMKLECTDPRKAVLPFELPDNTNIQTVEITGAGEIQLPKQVTAGWNCRLTEQPVNRHDASVTASFEGATLNGDGTFGDSGVTGTFTVQSGKDSTQVVTVVNDYQRERAALQLTKQLVGEQQHNVNDYLNNRETFAVTWECADTVAEGKTYSGTAQVPSDGTAVSITLADGRNLPASAICKFTENDEDKIPDGYKETVHSYHNVQVHVGDQQVRSVAGFKTVSEVPLTAKGVTSVDFKNSYWVNTEYFGLEKAVEGDPKNEVFPADTAFQFTFRCEITNLLPEQPMPKVIGKNLQYEDNEVRGEFVLTAGKTWSPGALPEGSQCWVKEKPLPEALQKKLDEKNLRMQANYVHLNEDRYDAGTTDSPDGPTLADRIGDAKRIPLVNDEVPLSDEDGRFALLVNSLYRTDGKVVVKKVDPDGKPLEGAKFAIYQAGTGDKPEGEPLFADLGFDGNDPTKFQVELKPGSYYLVETRSGTGSQLLAQPWRFNVEATNKDNVLEDLKFTLSAHAENSGLVELKQPENENDPWVIQVANVQAGSLPKTGGEWLPRAYGFAAILLLMATGLFISSRRRS